MSDQKRTSTSTSSGNTIKPEPVRSVRSRRFFVTFWERRDFLWDESIMQYACMCDDHCNEEHDGKWHGHYYVYYKNPRTWNQLKKYFGNSAHIESKIHSNSDAIDYILGRGEHANSKSNFHEQGEPPCDNGKHISTRRALEMTYDEMKELEDHRDVITIMKVRDLLDPGIDIDEDYKETLKVTYICGPSGAGKSLLAKKILKAEGYKRYHKVKHKNDFWNKVGLGTGVAIYDEFRDSHMPVSEFINFIDYNTHSMNIKGGSVYNRFERIVITSIDRPDEIYSNVGNEPRKQWLRRMEVILYDEENNTFLPPTKLVE